MVDKKIYEEVLAAAIIGLTHVTDRLKSVNNNSDTGEVLLWLEKIGKAVASIKGIEEIITGGNADAIKIRGGVKLSDHENIIRNIQ